MTNGGYCYRHVIGKVTAEESLPTYLAAQFPHSTQAQWQARCEAGEVLINGMTATAEQRLRPGATLLWNRPGWVEEETPQAYQTIFVDEHILIVNKPSGLPTLPGAGFYRNTLLSLVQVDFPTARPVHRLGRATSGLVLFALHAQAAAELGRQWSEVRKQYVALGSGVATEKSYDIRAPIGPQAHPRLGQVHAAGSDGKPAHSIARPLYRQADSTLFEVDLLTGRPHQIRIHLAFVGHPLVGDPLYAAGGQPRADRPGLPGDGGYWLHAQRLRFAHPLTGESLDLVATAPEPLRTE